jgi:hypothetical protein
MIGKLGFAIVALCLTSCASFQAQHENYIASAIELQSTALSDPLFAGILLELHEAGDVIWDERLTEEAKAEAGAFDNKIIWLLGKYESSGGLDRVNLKPWRKWIPPWSATTAKFNPNNGIVSLNLNRFNKDQFALANTFIHEKNHSFGLIHDSTQSRIGNQCDAGYLAGDLAEAILRSSVGNTGTTPHAPSCPALCGALEERGLWSACDANLSREAS